MYKFSLFIRNFPEKSLGHMRPRAFRLYLELVDNAREKPTWAG